MAYKTIALTGAETEVDISGQNCDIRNDGTGVVYAATAAGITAGADGVLSIPAGGAAKLLDSGGTVHLLGTGSVQLCGNDYAELVFKTAASASGGGGTGGVSRIYVDTGDSNTLEAAKTYADSAVQPVSAAVDVLNGTGDGSVSKTVADGIAQIIADAPEDLDTLKEISDWIAAHPADVAAINAAITQNTSDITANAAAIAEINSADSGILAQANTYTDTKSAETLNAAKEYADNKALTATEITLTAASWSDSGRADYPYKAVISDSGITSTDTAEVIIGLDYLGTAQSAKIASAGVTFDGGIELYAKTVPSADIRAAYYIVKGA